MPGSNTPRPPGSQIHVCPGCHTRTSSFQSIATERMARPVRNSLAGSTAGAKRECQAANSVLAEACAAATSGANSLTVAPGGFSNSTCLPAVSAAAARAPRTCGGVHSATASISGPCSSRSSSVAKWAIPPGAALRLATAASLMPVVFAMAGTCWSCAILPKPTIARRIMLMGRERGLWRRAAAPPARSAEINMQALQAREHDRDQTHCAQGRVAHRR